MDVEDLYEELLDPKTVPFLVLRKIFRKRFFPKLNQKIKRSIQKIPLDKKNKEFSSLVGLSEKISCGEKTAIKIIDLLLKKRNWNYITFAEPIINLKFEITGITSQYIKSVIKLNISYMYLLADSKRNSWFLDPTSYLDTQYIETILNNFNLLSHRPMGFSKKLKFKIWKDKYRVYISYSAYPTWSIQILTM